KAESTSTKEGKQNGGFVTNTECSLCSSVSSSSGFSFGFPSITCAISSFDLDIEPVKEGNFGIDEEQDEENASEEGL
ncbi:hypothetical protein ADUPG1_010315, partial [Aduncisulcus paluster]